MVAARQVAELGRRCSTPGPEVNLRVSNSLRSLAEPRPLESRGEPGAGRVAPPDCDHAPLRKYRKPRCSGPSSPLAK
ncbi:uncharacterized protein LOC115271742 isoform X2 [Suricata suricatta]|uniref:uncharacterized protein LOC115271742 isoform X2 n=1 Tax=Suricata suricatta TaxID=37032 RepID=UPI001156B5A7|nr:uncharacterized protein LOC115271742 isoform X2 [Suricata suricatta]